MAQAPSVNYSPREDDSMYSIDAIFGIEGILLPIIGCAGICGNIASIIHFGCCTKRRHNFKSYMLALGIVDLLLILSSFVIHSGLSWIELYQRVYILSLFYAPSPNIGNVTEGSINADDLCSAINNADNVSIKVEKTEKGRLWSVVETAPAKKGKK